MKVLGINVSAVTLPELNDVVCGAVERGERLYVGSQNLHGVYSYHRDEAMRTFQAGAVVRVDGMSLVLVAKLCGLPLRQQHRITWVDWLDPLFSMAERKAWKVCYCGAPEAVMNKAISEVQRRYPHLQFKGRNGFFENEDQEVKYVEEVNTSRPDILIVGMGMPRQEQFVMRHRDLLRVPVILTSGAALEYLAGAVRTPPRWMGRLGLEWLFRFAENPRRLAHRYLIEPWALVPLLLRDLWVHRVTRGWRRG